MGKRIGAVYQRSGFTLLEMAVSLSIVVLITAQVLVSFSGLREASTLNRAAQELAFDIRRAQNMALAVAPVALGLGGTLHIPQSVGILISTRSGIINGYVAYTYFFFSDQNRNGKYDGVSEQIEPLIVLPANIRITSITGEDSVNLGVHISFYTPEATPTMTNFNGVPIASFVDITLRGGSGATKIVRVLASGSVSVR